MKALVKRRAEPGLWLEDVPRPEIGINDVLIRVDRTGSGRANDAADPEPGFDGRLSGGAEFPDGQFLGWTPGQLPPLFEGDTAWWLDADSDFVVQLHMRPTGRREAVQVRIGLFFTDQAPRRTPVGRGRAQARRGRTRLGRARPVPFASGRPP